MSRDRRPFPVIRVTLLLVLVGVLLGCSNVKFVRGDDSYSFLKGETKLAFDFDYSKCSVGDHDSEEAYVRSKVEEKNEGGADKGEEWKEKWYDDKKMFHSAFLGRFRNHLAKVRLMVPAPEDQKGLKYKLLLVMEHIKIGFYGGPAGRNPVTAFSGAKIDSRLLFVENKAEGDTLAELEVDGVKTHSQHGQTRSRLSAAYRNVAAHYGDHLEKDLAHRRR